MTRSEEQLGWEMLQGDPSAALPLLERYRQPLFSLLWRLTGNPAEAEDLFQETFLRALQAKDHYDPSRPFRPWLFAIGINLARDRGRRASLPQAPRLTPDGLLPDTASTQEHLDSALSRRQLLERGLAHLPPPQQELLLLRFFYGFSEAELAETFAIPTGTVKSRLFHAIRRLRRSLASHQDPGTNQEG